MCICQLNRKVMFLGSSFQYCQHYINGYGRTEIACILCAIDGSARSIDCAALSMDPTIAQASIDRASIDRSRKYRWMVMYYISSVAIDLCLHCKARR